jgi:hypothetical protein
VWARCSEEGQPLREACDLCILIYTGVPASIAHGGAGAQFTAQFTCFTSTKVQILTPEKPQAGLLTVAVRALHLGADPSVRSSLYLLYRYKSTNTDTWGAPEASASGAYSDPSVCLLERQRRVEWRQGGTSRRRGMRRG